MTTDAATPQGRRAAPQVPAPPAGLAGWAGTLTRPGSGLGFWAAAFSVQPGVALGVALAVALVAAALRG